ncbi:MAG: GNAT family N-acetyltransferase, partial [Clostridia bacterium]|nr:GNAT family N-acetyltransferase [Clostridia bacterium]
MTALTDLSDIEIARVSYSPECVANIAAVCRRCFTDPWSERAVEDTLRAEQNYVITANNGEIGFAAASLALDTADILDVAVIPEMRGRGIARAMLE